jgi:flagellar basal body-associated protein FliL
MSAAAAAATADAPEAPKKKGKKLLFIIVGVLVLAIAGAAGALFILKKNTAEDDHEEDAPVAHVKKVDPKHAPTFLPLENMVVNLADTGGNRYIQIGLTLQLQDAATGEAVKAYMPSIRSAVLMLLAKRGKAQPGHHRRRLRGHGLRGRRPRGGRQQEEKAPRAAQPGAGRAVLQLHRAVTARAPPCPTRFCPRKRSMPCSRA